MQVDVYAPRHERVSRTTEERNNTLPLHHPSSFRFVPLRPVGVFVPSSESEPEAMERRVAHRTTPPGARRLKCSACCIEYSRAQACRRTPSLPIWRAVDHDQQWFSVVSGGLLYT